MIAPLWISGGHEWKPTFLLTSNMRICRRRQKNRWDLMEVATSLAHLQPRPICPLLSPTATYALKRVRWPAVVCFCTGMTFITSSRTAAPRRKSTIWNSLIGSENKKISSIDLILPSFTKRPSLVTGTHSSFSPDFPPRPRSYKHNMSEQVMIKQSIKTSASASSIPTSSSTKSSPFRHLKSLLKFSTLTCLMLQWIHLHHQ